ncbi:MAG: hypothetical protein FWF60_01395 [Oscillospiraceae bacterium]|nr:hypothetical protein [Oscillospiraceae bacterium]
MDKEAREKSSHRWAVISGIVGVASLIVAIIGLRTGIIPVGPTQTTTTEVSTTIEAPPTTETIVTTEETTATSNASATVGGPNSIGTTWSTTTTKAAMSTTPYLTITLDSMEEIWTEGYKNGLDSNGYNEFRLCCKISTSIDITHLNRSQVIECRRSDGTIVSIHYGGLGAVNKKSYSYYKAYCQAFEDGSTYGALVPGETYYWQTFVTIDDEVFESPVKSFVFSRP